MSNTAICTAYVSANAGSGHRDFSVLTVDSVACLIDLTRLSSKVNTPDVKWTRKPLAYRESNDYSHMCNPPFLDICQFCL